MSPMYNEAIVYTTSEDGFLLEGVQMCPTGATVQPISIVWIHGNASRFSDYPYVMIGRALASAGYPFISANTRGHDISTMLWQAAEDAPAPWGSPQSMPIGAGSAWERLDDVPKDLAAWVRRAAAEGTEGVVLVGHSSGAQRVVLYQAERQDARVVGIALASPDLRGFLPPGELDDARQMVAEGRGMDVLPAQPFAPWYRQSAQTVVNKADILAHMLTAPDGTPTIAAIQTPILAFFGTHEPGGATTLDLIRQHATSAVVTTQIIEGADHIYAGHATDVADRIAQWVATLQSDHSP
jgi:pimeloyl-ACP methyl ester carboxylesterase